MNTTGKEIFISTFCGFSKNAGDCLLSEKLQEISSLVNEKIIEKIRALTRYGKKEEAARLLDRIAPDMQPGMVVSYHRRLLMYKGLISPDELLTLNPNDLELVTMGFGLANYYYEIGEDAKGDDMIRRVLEAGKEDAWSAFGYQAALVEKKRRHL